MITIALDAMGGDYGTEVVVPAALQALKAHSNLQIILVGDETTLSHEIKAHNAGAQDRLDIHHASEIVMMDESPSRALRNKKDSSMRVAINLVKEGIADACVSAGNTGALMATAKFVLKTISGIDRPAIMSQMPTMHNSTWLLDLGANVDSCAETLFQFAIMGSTLASAVLEIPEPTVGLLNIGVEEVKGNDQVKRTAQLLLESKAINYTGYVEGDDIYKGTTHVIVCDGFVGNVALKSSEGIANLLRDYMQKAFNRNIFTRLAGFLLMPALNTFKKRCDPARYNGASLLGLNGIVIKSHGGANIVGFNHAIEVALLEVKQNVPQLISERVSQILHEEP